jgi:hypothetical protein
MALQPTAQQLMALRLILALQPTALLALQPTALLAR